MYLFLREQIKFILKKILSAVKFIMKEEIFYNAIENGVLSQDIYKYKKDIYKSLVFFIDICV